MRENAEGGAGRRPPDPGWAGGSRRNGAGAEVGTAQGLSKVKTEASCCALALAGLAFVSPLPGTKGPLRESDAPRAEGRPTVRMARLTFLPSVLHERDF